MPPNVPSYGKWRKAGKNLSHIPYVAVTELTFHAAQSRTFEIAQTQLVQTSIKHGLLVRQILFTDPAGANSPPPAESGTPSEISKEPGLSGSSSESQDELSTEEKRLIARMGLEEFEFI